MFNDEIEKVRVNAIQSLRKIGSLWTLELNAELLEIALGALDDSDPVTRHAMHGLLKYVFSKYNIGFLVHLTHSLQSRALD